MTKWYIHTKEIEQLVEAESSWAAFDTLKDRPLEDFGLLCSVVGHGKESQSTVAVRTSSLLFRWHRDDDARAAVATAIANGLPDTTKADLEIAGR